MLQGVFNDRFSSLSLLMHTLGLLHGDGNGTNTGLYKPIGTKNLSFKEKVETIHLVASEIMFHRTMFIKIT